MPNIQPTSSTKVTQEVAFMDGCVADVGRLALPDQSQEAMRGAQGPHLGLAPFLGAPRSVASLLEGPPEKQKATLSCFLNKGQSGRGLEPVCRVLPGGEVAKGGRLAWRGLPCVGQGRQVQLARQVLGGQVEAAQLGQGVGALQRRGDGQAGQPQPGFNLLRPLFHQPRLPMDAVDAVAAGAPREVGAPGRGRGVGDGLQEVLGEGAHVVPPGGEGRGGLLGGSGSQEGLRELLRGPLGGKRQSTLKRHHLLGLLFQDGRHVSGASGTLLALPGRVGGWALEALQFLGVLAHQPGFLELQKRLLVLHQSKCFRSAVCRASFRGKESCLETGLLSQREGLEPGEAPPGAFRASLGFSEGPQGQPEAGRPGLTSWASLPTTIGSRLLALGSWGSFRGALQKACSREAGNEGWVQTVARWPGDAAGGASGGSLKASGGDPPKGYMQSVQDL
ncbi:hypothetical protein E2320_012415 [Naja naja]|nr:hypothetical protein E2320_012415 [Naja naja]